MISLFGVGEYCFNWVIKLVSFLVLFLIIVIVFIGECIFFFFL